MIKRSKTQFICLLIAAGVSVSTFSAQASTHSKRLHHKSRHSDVVSSKKHSDRIDAINVAQITKINAQAAAAAKLSSSLFSSQNATYVNPSKSMFDFGPQSQNIKYDKRMIEAAQIAAMRARAHSTSRCWHAVKNALVAANLVPTRPTTEYAKEAGDELQSKFGFKKIAVQDPFAAPIGSVLVYGGHGAGHVEFRTPAGFVSDFTSAKPSRRPLLGVYVKPS